MKPNKLRNLLLLLGILGTIAYYGKPEFVNPPDSSITLKPKEFDYYAQSVVDRNQLKRDTIVLHSIIRDQRTIIFTQKDQLQGDSISMVAKDSSSSVYRRAFYKEEGLRTKSDKKLKRFENLSLILGSAFVVLVGVLLIIH